MMFAAMETNRCGTTQNVGMDYRRSSRFKYRKVRSARRGKNQIRCCANLCDKPQRTYAASVNGRSPGTGLERALECLSDNSCARWIQSAVMCREDDTRCCR